MSWLNLRRFLPARRVWRLLTTKIQSKLHKLHSSRYIKKPNNHRHLHTTKSRVVFWPALSLQAGPRRRKRIAQHAYTVCHHHRHRPQKKPPPVFIDQLFIEPVSVPVLKSHVVPPLATAAAAAATSKKDSAGAMKTKPVHHPASSTENGKNKTADDMWESLALASPQMHGINDRAEEFITRFRAELQLQETLARHL